MQKLKSTHCENERSEYSTSTTISSCEFHLPSATFFVRTICRAQWHFVCCRFVTLAIHYHCLLLFTTRRCIQFNAKSSAAYELITLNYPMKMHKMNSGTRDADKAAMQRN